MEKLLARFLSPPRVVVAWQFLRFGTVGFVGFFFDAGTVYASKALVGLYVAGVLGYGVAATVTWWLNRQWTFHGLGGNGPILRQWAAFMSANFVGFIVNRGIYMLLITFSAFCAAHPVFAVLGGIPAGMVFNFTLSRRVVFKADAS
jgi:putative flippase GtrA